MEQNGLFRKEALDTVSNPEQLDQHVRITRPYIWILISAITVMAIFVGIWAFTGDMSSGVDSVGVVFPADSVMISNAMSSGTVTDVLVKENTQVEKGDVLAVIPNISLLQQIASLRSAGDSAALNALKYQYITSSFIVADKAGTINGIASLNSSVQEGDQVAINVSDKSNSNSKEILAYVPFSTAINFKVGMQAQVTPANVKREEYGYMIGTVTRIGTSTVTEESILASMGTKKYISALGLTADCVEIRIRLNVDSATKSGFEWSNSKGGTVSVDVGTICTVKFVTESKRPIDLLI
ncbi:MAG: biotin/lipoyl-binding protein [Clostridia bacterium]|nr:biotin/lipoyl-binding protein [Clostridia bacterium]